MVKIIRVVVLAASALGLAACDGGSSPPHAPTVTLTSSATDVAVNGVVTLTWSTTHATSCIASGAWNHPQGIDGSEGVLVSQTSTYTISCSGRGGVATDSVTIRAWNPPSSSLTTDLISVLPNGTVQLSWSSQNATTCIGSGGLSGTLALSGSQTSAPLTETATFAIGCSNPVFGAATSTVVVQVVTSRYTVLELPMERATALNDAGDVAGTRRPANYGSPVDAVVWTEGSIVYARACQTPPFCYYGYTPRAMNAARTVIGSRIYQTGSLRWWSFVWHFGDSSDPAQGYLDGVFNADFLSLYDINDAGQIVGSEGPQGYAVLITGETVVRLSDFYSWANAINAAGHVVGDFYTTDDAKYHLFLYVDGTMNDLGTLGGGQCHPSGINAFDAIVGWENSVGGTRAFLYANSRFTDLGSLGGATSRATAINDAGQIVGTSTLAGADPRQQPERAFLYVDGKMIDLNNLVAPLPVVLSEAPEINNRGQIIANACPPWGTTPSCRAYLLTPVTQP